MAFVAWRHSSHLWVDGIQDSGGGHGCGSDFEVLVFVLTDLLVIDDW